MTAEKPLPRVLCLDDEPRVLNGLENQLCFDYEVETYTSGVDALARLEDKSQPAFDLIISDMRMPEMDGATFLREARQRVPDVARVLLTGQSDLQSAASAVNEGGIFRFLQKPCDADLLISTVTSGSQHTALLRAERELLHGTLNGTVRLLIDVLGIVSPAAFRSIGEVRDTAVSAAEALGMENAWEVEAASSLYRLGAVSFPDEVMVKALAGQPLADAEKDMYDRLAETSAGLLENIPRLAGVAELIRAADRIRQGKGAGPDVNADAAYLVAAAEEIDVQLAGGASWPRAAQAAAKRLGIPPHISAVLKGKGRGSHDAPLFLGIGDLVCGMLLDDDVLTAGGQPLVRKGTKVSDALLVRLRNFAANQGIREPIRVRWAADAQGVGVEPDGRG